MKKYKKIIFVIVVFILSITSNVYATDDNMGDFFSEAGKITLKASNNSVKVGDTVTISLTASYENGIECVNSTLIYDETKLELTNMEMKNYFSNQSGEDAETGKFVLTALYGDIGSPENAPTESEYIVLTFKVLDKVNTGEILSVKFSENEIIDPNLETILVENKEITFTVIGEQKPTGEQKKPTEQKQEEPKKEQQDDTIADKNINKAGSKKYTIILIIVVGIIVILYRKYKKNSDIY